MERIAVAIDGPTGAGKTTLARLVARDTGFIYVDTGAMYRAVGLYVLRKGFDSRDQAGIERCLPEISLSIVHTGGAQRILLLGEDVSEAIRGETASRYASDVSAVPAVRSFLLDTQRGFAREANVVMEGRDIGTVVLPQAQVKIFLTATSIVRAVRRHKELVAKGESITLEAVHKALLERDFNDSNRAAAPLRPADDSVIVDTTHLTLEQVRCELIAIIKEKTGV